MISGASGGDDYATRAGRQRSPTKTAVRFTYKATVKLVVIMT